jgi:putative transcriptional regulator
MDESLQGRLLISSSGLGDPNFFRTVVLILQHGEEGALGLVLNRPLGDGTLGQFAEQVFGGVSLREGVLYEGGPVQKREVALAVYDEIASDLGMPVAPGLLFTGDLEVIEQLLEATDGDVRFFVGYSGWGPGQLEQEMTEQSWLSLPARREHIFSPIDRLWELVRTELLLGRRLNPSAMPHDPRLN